MQLCSRLRFAGGYDIDGEVLATLNISGAPSSFAKGLLAAADDITRDALLAASTSWLEKEDIRRLPAEVVPFAVEVRGGGSGVMVTR